MGKVDLDLLRFSRTFRKGGGKGRAAPSGWVHDTFMSDVRDFFPAIFPPPSPPLSLCWAQRVGWDGDCSGSRSFTMDIGEQRFFFCRYKVVTCLYDDVGLISRPDRMNDLFLHYFLCSPPSRLPSFYLMLTRSTKWYKYLGYCIVTLGILGISESHPA